MMIVGLDNYASESVADHLWLAGIPNEPAAVATALLVCAKLNERLTVNEGGRHYVVKPDDYKLWRGLEEII